MLGIKDDGEKDREGGFSDGIVCVEINDDDDNDKKDCGVE